LRVALQLPNDRRALVIDAEVFDSSQTAEGFQVRCRWVHLDEHTRGRALRWTLARLAASGSTEKRAAGWDLPALRRPGGQPGPRDRATFSWRRTLRPWQAALAQGELGVFSYFGSVLFALPLGLAVLLPMWIGGLLAVWMRGERLSVAALTGPAFA